MTAPINVSDGDLVWHEVRREAGTIRQVGTGFEVRWDDVQPASELTYDLAAELSMLQGRT